MPITRRALTTTALGTAIAVPGTFAILRHPRGAETVHLAQVVELSGAGATAGGNWRRGVDFGVEDINKAGGIMGRQIVLTTSDTQSNPGVSRAMVQKALDADPYVIIGPIYSGSIKVNMALAKAAGVSQIMGGDAADLTQMGNPYIFRTNVSQITAMPKLANWVDTSLKAKKIAVLWVNNDFGKGGRDMFNKQAKARGMTIVADIPSEQGQIDFASDVIRIAGSGADAALIYTNEDESARFLIEARKQSLKMPLFGETTLIGQKVVELAGAAAEGVYGHVGLSADVPVPALQEYGRRYLARYNDHPDHNSIKGYIAVAMVDAVTKKMGKFDRANFNKTLHGLTITTAMEPRIMMDTTWDNTGEMNRQTWMVRVENGKQTVIETLGPLTA